MAHVGPLREAALAYLAAPRGALFCAVCTKSLPDMQVLRDTFGDDELTLVGIPVAEEDTVEQLREYVAKTRPAYSVQIGMPQELTDRVRKTVASMLHADGEATPASFVTDSSGRIITARWGVPTVSELRRLQATATE